MKEKDLYYLSRGQLHDIIIEQDEVIQQLRNSISVLQEESVILEERTVTLDEPYGMWNPGMSKLRDLLDELGIEYTVLSKVIYKKGNVE